MPIQRLPVVQVVLVQAVAVLVKVIAAQVALLVAHLTAVILNKLNRLLHIPNLALELLYPYCAKQKVGFISI